MVRNLKILQRLAVGLRNINGRHSFYRSIQMVKGVLLDKVSNLGVHSTKWLIFLYQEDAICFPDRVQKYLNQGGRMERRSSTSTETPCFSCNVSITCGRPYETCMCNIDKIITRHTQWRAFPRGIIKSSSSGTSP